MNPIDLLERLHRSIDPLRVGSQPALPGVSLRAQQPWWWLSIPSRDEEPNAVPTTFEAQASNEEPSRPWPRSLAVSWA